MTIVGPLLTYEYEIRTMTVKIKQKLITKKFQEQYAPMDQCLRTH